MLRDKTESKPGQKRSSSVVIVGGGLSGVSAALKLLWRTAFPLQIFLIDPHEEPGRGVAYSTRDLEHRLNAPARRHIIRPGEPDHFPRWLSNNAIAEGWPGPEDGNFVEAFSPRWLFGSYIQSELKAAVRGAHTDVVFKHIQQAAVDIKKDGDGLAVGLADGEWLKADHVILANGVFTSSGGMEVATALEDDSRYLSNPWKEGIFESLLKAHDVAIIGSHLTMIDCVASLERRGYRGSYTVVSRLGLMPNPAYTGEPWHDFLADREPPTTALSLLKLLRTEIASATAAGFNWQAVAASIRPHIGALWRTASLAEKRRFLRHLQSRTLGHSAPPSAIALVERAVREGRLTSIAGRVARIDICGERLGIHLRPRGATSAIYHQTDRVIRCIGFEYDWSRIDDRLVQNLLRRGLVRPGPLNSGIDADENGAIIAADGTLSKSFSAIGHPLNGSAFYESSASSALREQSTVLADRLLPLLEVTRSATPSHMEAIYDDR
ncbi:putative NAD(P)/FAD-binding protein YdhS [Methylovirgula ligni]|uniref:Putative NAD(P)/FAD-binding protein YdhS n=1 Tax=Methylovirgula ligni TaxID=569860 RepID=A0A3D9YYR3_9HYPH|nr:FAD/NAD(P)-binding protein [Methylovirgula ligni]REF84059.1 putative NAD(P)/FAD-binding protein YdhS [Methylovirgula ligni]